MKENIEIKTIILYFGLFFITIGAIAVFFIPGLLDSKHLISFDSGHYFTIKETGYQFNDVAFFPLFPMLWKFFHLGNWGISIFNIVLFAIFVWLLFRNLKPSVPEMFLYLAIPSFMFFYIPYTESCFFSGSVLLVLGLKKENLWLSLTGLFVCSLARPAFSVYFPALIIAEFLSSEINKQMFIRIGLYLLVIVVGMCLVALVQHADTGRWFEFFSAQKAWDNRLRLPKFPLTSWAGGLIVRLDATAALIGVISGLFVFGKLINFKFLQKLILPKEVVFSLAYLGGITISVLAFRGGSLHSLNRFVFAVPLIIVVLHYYFTQNFNLKTKHILWISLVIFLFWTCAGSYVHIQTTLKFLYLTIYLALFLTIRHPVKKISRVSLVLFIAISFAFQVFFYVRFLTGGWIG